MVKHLHFLARQLLRVDAAQGAQRGQPVVHGILPAGPSFSIPGVFKRGGSMNGAASVFRHGAGAAYSFLI